MHHHPARPFRAVLAAIVAAAVPLALAGCASASDGDAVGDSSQPSPSASAEPTSSEAEAIDTSDWLEYSTHDGDMTYRYPADWVLESESTFFSPDADRDDVQEPYERWMDGSTLTAPNGEQLLEAYDVVDLGGACGDPENFQPVEVLATEPLEGASTETAIATLAIGTVDGRWTFGMGLVSGQLSTVASCVAHFTTGTSDGGMLIGTRSTITSAGDDPLWTIDTLEDAAAYMETEEYATILEILRSVRLT